MVEGRAAGPVLLLLVEDVVDLLRQLGALKRICAVRNLSSLSEAIACMRTAAECSSNSAPSKARFIRGGAAAFHTCKLAFATKI